MDVVLQARGLRKSFGGGGLWRKEPGKRAVRDVDLRLRAGSTLAIVGESGSGKSTLARLLMRLLPADAGEIFLRGRPFHALRGAALRRERRYIQMVFQDPFASLNPRMRIGSTVGEGLRVHWPELSRQQRRRRVAEVLQQCGIDADAMDRYPHQFSGGQRQRIGIARALVVQPDVLILDEPVSALDVSIQAQILNLLRDLQQRLGLSYIFISHDLSVVRHIADEVMVMFAGQVVEQGTVMRVFDAPRHPYTAALLEAMPLAHPAERSALADVAVREEDEGVAELGCAFHLRCPHARGDCREADGPALLRDGYRCLHPLPLEE